MKTQIIQLEPHDDFISVRDRMGWGQTTRIILVWPLKGTILNRRLDLILLKRHSMSLGSQLALVTRNREVRYQAAKLDIPVYTSVRKAEQSRWRKDRKRRKREKKQKDLFRSSKIGPRIGRDKLDDLRKRAHPQTPAWMRRPGFRIFFFTIGVLAALTVGAVFIPRAEIHLSPETLVNTVTISVDASPEYSSVDISGAVPVRWASSIVEGRDSTPASGYTMIPNDTASGRVTFTNLTDQPITIPSGTVVSTQDETPVRFLTEEEVTIPVDHQDATATVRAVYAGSIGNVSANTITAIEDKLGLNLSVNNRRATSGGSDMTASSPVEEDLSLVFDQLYSSLEYTAASELGDGLVSGDILLETTPILNQTIQEEFLPDLGHPADNLNLTLRLEFKLPYVSADDLYQLGNLVVESHTPDQYSPLPGTLTFTHISDPVPSGDNQANWRMQADWEMGANLNPSQVVFLVMGRDPVEAVKILTENLPVEDEVAIVITPKWWPRLPMLPFQITVSSPTSDLLTDSFAQE